MEALVLPGWEVGKTVTKLFLGLMGHLGTTPTGTRGNQTIVMVKTVFTPGLIIKISGMIAPARAGETGRLFARKVKPENHFTHTIQR